MDNDKLKKTIYQNHQFLDLLRYYKTIDKIDIADRLNLSVPTIYKTIDELRKYNVIIKGNHLSINKNFGAFVGISIGSSLCKIIFLHFDFTLYTKDEFIEFKKQLSSSIGKHINNDENYTHSVQSDENYIYFSTPTKFKIIRNILDSIFVDLIQFNSSKKFNLLGIGISSTGVVNEKKQMIHEAHNLPDMEHRALSDLLKPTTEQYFKSNNINVSLIKNSNASVLCEKVLLYQNNSQYMDRKNIISIYLGVGLGAGFIFNGTFYSGTHGYTGEIGHMSAPTYEELEESVSYDVEEKCTCGKHSCYDYKIRKYIFEKNKTDFAKMNSSDIHDYLLNNPNKTRYLSKYLGSIVNMLATLLNVDLIAIGGKLQKSMDLLINAIDDERYDNPFTYNRNDCKVTASIEGVRSPSIGAAIYSYYEKYDIPCVWDI